MWFQAAVLTYGAVVHVVQLLGGWPPYPWAPGWLAAYFVALTVLDPLAAALLVARRAAGLYQAAISVVAVASVVTARLARPWMVHRVHHGRSRSGPRVTGPPR